MKSNEIPGHDSSQYQAQSMTETRYHFKKREDKSATYVLPLCKYQNQLYIKDVDRECLEMHDEYLWH